MSRDRLFEQYMRGDELGIENDFESEPQNPYIQSRGSSLGGGGGGGGGVPRALSVPTPPPYDPNGNSGNAVFTKPPLHPPSHSGTPDRPSSRGASSTPSQRGVSQTPTPMPDASVQAKRQAESAALEKKNQMLVEQEEEIVAHEATIAALRAENAALRAENRRPPQPSGVPQQEYDALKREFDEAGLLTEQAGALLQKVQTDLDASQREAEALLERLLPGELQRIQFDAVPQLVSHVGRRVEELLQSTLDAAARLEGEAEALRGGGEAEKRAARLEAELGESSQKATGLAESVALLQEELSGYRLHGSGSDNVQLETDLRRSEKAREEADKQRLSQSQLLKTTEQAYKRLEEEVRVLRRQMNAGSVGSSERLGTEVMQGELYKLGTVANNAPAQWKKRFFVGDQTCMQYFEKQEEAGTASLAKGVRYYASQQTFVSRFVSDPAHLSDGSQRVMGVTSLHPKASDQGSYYFGFIPKHDNQLSTQAFLLRTRSRDTWLSWCKFLSKMLYGGSSANPQTPGQKSESASFASPEVIGGVTPPYGQRQQPAAQSDFLTEDGDSLRGTLSSELKKTDDALRAMTAEQAPLKKRVDEGIVEVAQLKAELEETRHTLDIKAKTVDVYQREALKHGEDVADLRQQNRALSDAVQAAATEAATLREEVTTLRDQQLTAVKETQGRTHDTPITCTAGTSAPHPEVAPVEVQTDPLAPTESEGTNEMVRSLEARLRDAAEQHNETNERMKEQEEQHDAQIAAFCEQVLKDMEAIKLQSKMEVARRDEDWQKEVEIWQQLVAEKEQQIAMSAHKTKFQNAPGVVEIADALPGQHTNTAEAQWRVIGSSSAGHQPSTVLSLKLSTSGGVTVVSGEGVDGPRTYGTRIAVDKRKLSQVSVTDNPTTRDSMSRTWKFRSLSSDGSAVALSLSIVPNGAEADSGGRPLPLAAGHSHAPRAALEGPAQPIPQSHPRRGSASSSLSHARSSSAKGRDSPFRTRNGSRRNSQVFVP